MFRRLVFEDSAALFTLAAFITAVSIYVTIAWRAIRMKRSQVAQFANLPFETETPAAVGAQAGCASEDQTIERHTGSASRPILPSR
jgi:hypothetical protein